MSKENQPGTPVTLTFEQLKELLAAAQAKPNVLEQKAIDAELEKERKRDLARVQLAKIEAEAMQRKKDGCSHLRLPMSAGKLGGHAAQKGTPGAEWTTGGQAHSTELATLICTRCSATWQFKPTSAEYQAIEQSGMMGWRPPDESRIVRESVA
jgi:hypothetical protein